MTSGARIRPSSQKNKLLPSPVCTQVLNATTRFPLASFEVIIGLVHPPFVALRSSSWVLTVTASEGTQFYPLSSELIVVMLSTRVFPGIRIEGGGGAFLNI